MRSVRGRNSPGAATGKRQRQLRVESPRITVHALPAGFEEDHALRSAFIRELTLEQLALGSIARTQRSRKKIPRTLVHYWHDHDALPDDVGACLGSWSRLRSQGFDFRMFDDRSAAAYMAVNYGSRERAAFGRCRHPAMRSDYLRLCFILAEGGLYVDADDVLCAGNGWTRLFDDDRLKIQPLCYDIDAAEMVTAGAIWRADLPTTGRIFYVNNNPIAAPPDHPVVRRALERATDRLLADDSRPEIQETTGPGNLTAVLAAHARELRLRGQVPDFALLKDWEGIAQTCWELSYRGDERNWRNMDRS